MRFGTRIVALVAILALHSGTSVQATPNLTGYRTVKSVTDIPIPKRLALVATAGLGRIGPVRHEFTPHEIGTCIDQGLAWDILFELGTSSAPFTHAVRLVALYDLRGRCAIVQL